MAAVLGSLVLAVVLIQTSRHRECKKDEVVQQMQVEHQEATEEAQQKQEFQYSDYLSNSLQQRNNFLDYQSEKILFPKYDSSEPIITQGQQFQELERSTNPLGVPYSASLSHVAKLTPYSIELMPGGERPTMTSLPQVSNEQSFGTIAGRTPAPFYDPKWKNQSKNVLPNPYDNKDPMNNYVTGESTIPALFNTMPDKQTPAEVWMERDVKKSFDFKRQDRNPYTYEYTQWNKNKANANAPSEMAPIHHKSPAKLSQQLDRKPTVQNAVKPTNESEQEWTAPQLRGNFMPKAQPGAIPGTNPQPKWMNAQSAETIVRSGDKSDRLPIPVSYTNANNGSHSSAGAIMRSSQPVIYKPAPPSKILKNERDDAPLPAVYAPFSSQTYGTTANKPQSGAANVRAPIPIDSKRNENRFPMPYGGQGRDGNPLTMNSPIATGAAIQPLYVGAKESRSYKQQMVDQLQPTYNNRAMDRAMPVQPDPGFKDVAKRLRDDNSYVPMMYNTASTAIGGKTNVSPLHTVSAPVVETRR